MTEKQLQKLEAEIINIVCNGLFEAILAEGGLQDDGNDMTVAFPPKYTRKLRKVIRSI